MLSDTLYEAGAAIRSYQTEFSDLYDQMKPRLCPTEWCSLDDHGSSQRAG